MCDASFRSNRRNRELPAGAGSSTSSTSNRTTPLIRDQNGLWCFDPGLQAFVQRFPGEFEREWADGVDGVEVTATDREPFPGVLAVRGKQEPFHGDLGAFFFGHSDDPVVRDAGGCVLRA